MQQKILEQVFYPFYLYLISKKKKEIRIFSGVKRERKNPIAI
jgi:hypothetical protein